MGLTNILNFEKINIDQLQKGLKHLGLNLSKFENIQDEQIAGLIELFKRTVSINPHSTTKFTKMELRAKLEKALKSQNNVQLLNQIEPQIQSVTKVIETVHPGQYEKPQKQAILPLAIRKLGKVKFFDLTKGFGYVYSYDDDQKECYIHASKLITSGIGEDDIVVFETISSKKKPGELDAINVSNKIPVFIFNKVSSIKSSVFPIFNNHLDKEIPLTDKHDNGFAIITAKSRSSSWKGTNLPAEKISKSDSIYFSQKIIVKFLPYLHEYLPVIELLTELIKAENKENELNIIYGEAINQFEQRSISDISKEIKDIRGVSFLRPFFEEKKKTLNKISFVLWTHGGLNILPLPNTQKEEDMWMGEIIPSLNWKYLQVVLTNLHKEQGASKQVEKTYMFLMKRGWEINSKAELEIVISFLSNFKSIFPSIGLVESNFICKNNQFYIDLFNKRLLIELSEDRINKYINAIISDAEKAEFIETLPSDKILSYYDAYPSLSNKKEEYITSVLEKEFSKIDYLCFDLESDGEQISEFAWKNIAHTKSDKDFKLRDEGLSELVQLINSEVILIGQNIREHDLPILAKHGASPSAELIWDTLEMEMLLNPERFSYGLKAPHNALPDVELTYLLFKNQLSRIIVSQNKFTAVKDFLPSKAIDAINNISLNLNLASLDYSFFEGKSNDFYRPNPTNQNISDQTFSKLCEKMVGNDKKVVIAPDFLWNTLSHQFDLSFYSESRTWGYCLSKEKITSNLRENKLLSAILCQFVDSYNLKSIQPYFQHLPFAIRLKLTPEQATLICDYVEGDLGKLTNKTLCIKPTDIEKLKNYSNEIPDISLIIVGKELYNLTSKIQLGQDFDFATIFNSLKNEPIWLQMSGGKSFINIDQNHCKKLGITKFPEFIQNIWLEKIGKGKFKVWCNLNFEACINDLQLKKVYYIDWIDESNIQANAYIIRPDVKNSGYVAEQKRVNPESLFRKMYWTYQFKLFEGIGRLNKPKVLIINDELEIDKLSAFARIKGYFIPDTKAALARQVEILHSHIAQNKMIIATIQTLDRVISSNYVGPLDLIWDSFLLQEKLQMLKGGMPNDWQTNEVIKEDDYQSNAISVQKDYDLFSLIKLHQPLIDYYYKMLYDNNPNSQLFLCDTRLTDYNGIEKSMNINAKTVQMWLKASDYEADKEIASEYFSSTHENADIDFNIDEAKEVLRQIFLIPDDGSIPYQWHDYQHPCLNEILPGKKDLLISLPTGAGKSLLFQGPALFRSAFSNKLSIVISPLRALMQDQVDGLWNKGFYSNVEFLSGDKSLVEIRDIYRRVSGGEITLLYITPERFRSRSFENCLLTRMDADSGLEYVVFDEAHCISQWGQEFRPDYLNAGRKVAGYSRIYHMRKLLFSATISEQVFEEISIIMPGVVTIEGTEKSYNPVRDHIKMDFKHNVVENDRLLEIANYLKSGKFNPKLSRAIIFVKSRKKVEECTLIMSDILKEVNGTDCSFIEMVGAFHAGMDSEDRKDTYEKYKSGDIVILFATKAFGMGMDIPNIHFVLHYSPPSTFEDFLQEVGRAGRNEKQRLEAGFNNTENPINTLCLTTNDDFAKLKDQLHESRISWHEVKDIKLILEEYLARFKPLIPDADIPVAIPFNLYTNKKGSINEGFETKFRIALHWLERLERINLGYFTITHLEFETASLNKLSDQIINCPDKDCEKVCYAITELSPNDSSSNKVLQLSIASLRSASKLSLENLFTALLKVHSAGILKLLQEVVIEPTKTRLGETNYCKDIYNENEKYPALQIIFSLANKILGSVPSNSSKMFEGEELDDFLKDSIKEYINFEKLPWTIKVQVKEQTREFNNYIKDIFKKRSKHAFTIIRLLGKTKHETKMEKVFDENRKIKIKQSVFNGYHKKAEWSKQINKLEKDCIKLLDYITKNYFDKNIKNFNWPDIISELNFKENVQYLSDLLFILSVLGYCNTGGLLPTGIEVFLTSIKKIEETDLQSLDKKIFEEFEETRKVRELKLIALEVLAGFQKGSNDASAVRQKQDVFIRKYFGCNSLESLLQLLQDQLSPNDPLLVKWRGDAIKSHEDRLNIEQRKIYDSEINQHINVMAGPGSGKTHTLTLRVARLVHHMGINPEEILVLAYNRAVVSELRERLGKLFNDLGYGNLAKRIKIFTFHGLAKKYCLNEVDGKPFEEWENILLNQLNRNPGHIMNYLAPLKHILIDEFQDINNVRINLINRLYQLTDVFLFIIGDPNQSIYGFERIKEGGSISPWPYYKNFNQIFNPTLFELYDNHRSYPEILKLASKILTLPAEHQHLIPRPTRVPDDKFVINYAEVIDRTKQSVDWWDKIAPLIEEKVEQRPYKQIAILFRTNNEVYRGFQKVKALNLPKIRIRIQGSLPYMFTRIRECHAIMVFIKSKIGLQIPADFKQTLDMFISDLISKNQNWNHFYLRVIQALVLDYLDEQDESQLFENLLEFITEMTFKDDGQLYKIYEKHFEIVSNATQETEIVLTTMHKVKGLEFDCVIIPPSFSNLPLKATEILSSDELIDQLDEEKRLSFVAYSRARYRLVIFKHLREIALANNSQYVIPEEANIRLGIPVQPEIKKLKINWAAKSFNFNGGVNNYIKSSIKSGDFVFIRKREIPYNGQHFVVFELFKENTARPIGELAAHKNIMRDHQSVSGFVVCEVVVWTYEDTCKYDEENGTNFSNDWCQQAKNEGYIYLVDFAGFGVPSD